MADTITIDIAAGGTAVISTDELTIDGSPQHLERIKVALGANNAYQKDLSAGQSNMAGSIPVVVASDQSPITTTRPAARNTRGVASSVAMSATATVASFVADAAFRFRGFVGTGTADGKWTVRYAATPKYAVRTNLTNPTAYLVLPNGEAPGATVTVIVEVTNNGTDVAEFEATILGE